MSGYEIAHLDASNSAPVAENSGSVCLSELFLVTWYTNLAENIQFSPFLP